MLDEWVYRDGPLLNRICAGEKIINAAGANWCFLSTSAGFYLFFKSI